MPAQKVKLIIIGALVGALFLTPIPPILYAAMSLNFTDLPNSVNGNDPFTVNVGLKDAPKETTYYLRAALFEADTFKYFGYTLNQLDQWHNVPGEPTKFLEIFTNNEGSWSGQLKAKADLDSSYFKGEGEYQFKIGRYTESGKSLSWSDNNGSIMINYESPPSPEPATSPSPTPIPIPSPAPSLSPSVKPSLKPTPQLTPSPDSTDSGLMVLATESGEVLGTTESAKPKNPYLVSIVLSLLGVGLVGGSGLGFYLQSKKKV